MWSSLDRLASRATLRSLAGLHHLTYTLISVVDIWMVAAAPRGTATDGGGEVTPTKTRGHLRPRSGSGSGSGPSLGSGDHPHPVLPYDRAHGIVWDAVSSMESGSLLLLASTLPALRELGMTILGLARRLRTLLSDPIVNHSALARTNSAETMSTTASTTSTHPWTPRVSVSGSGLGRGVEGAVGKAPHAATGTTGMGMGTVRVPFPTPSLLDVIELEGDDVATDCYWDIGDYSDLWRVERAVPPHVTFASLLVSGGTALDDPDQRRWYRVVNEIAKRAVEAGSPGLDMCLEQV